MSGHSKWANIKHRKEKSDAQKGKVFTKIGREIVVAVRQGGPDPEANSKLKEVILKAKAANIPNDNITRSIKKAAGDQNADDYEEITYEGYGPGGVAVIVETLTNNRNRTAGDLRHYFDKYGGNLGTQGCVSFMFEKKGVLIVEKDTKIHEEDLMLNAIEFGADDFNVEDDFYEILTEPEKFSDIRNKLESIGCEFLSTSIEMIPVTTTKLEDAKQIEQMDSLIDHLEDLDDVKNIYHNME
jgi:YebC/PmpR family DNA-binding regulatory protein